MVNTFIMLTYLAINIIHYIMTYRRFSEYQDWQYTP